MATIIPFVTDISRVRCYSPFAIKENDMPAPLSLDGQRFGRLTVVSQNGKTVHGARKWDCVCDCGNTLSVSGNSLKSGNTTSCGCYARDQKREFMATRKTHGMSHTPEHNTWLEIHRRCEDPKRESYATHGARGIRVCERWKTFENFYADMGKRPSAKYSIERIDNDGNYEPGNCKWATASEQGLNRRNNFIVTAFGRTGPLATFIPSEGGKSRAYKLAHQRIKNGWDAERAISAPSRLRRTVCR